MKPQATSSAAPAFPRQLGTRSLVLTPAGECDGEALHALWNLAEVRANLWGGHPLSREQTREMTARSAWLHERRGYGFWVAREAAGAAPIGFGGYWFLHDDHQPELLYAIERTHAGRGLATQMVHALVAYGWSVLHLAEIRATTHAGNRASVRLLRRLGFAPVGRGAPRTDGLQAWRMTPMPVDDSWGT